MISSAAPDVSDREIRAVEEALRSGTLSTGEVVESFEREFSSFLRREHGAAVCSGGTALELALEVADLQPGDGVVVSPRNCAAVLYPILRQDLVPVFADVEAGAHDLDPAAVREVLDSVDREVGGLLATHLHGAACDLDGLVAVARAHDLELIEDVSQSPGAVGDGGLVGSIGSLTICSFGATKNITTAEGGMVVGDDRERIEAIRSLRSSSHPDAPRPSRSVRMSDLQAAIGLEQLERYDDIVDRRRRVAEIYRTNLPDGVTRSRWPHTREHVYSNYPVFVEDPESLRAYLAEQGIESSTYETPLHDYQCLHETAWVAGDCSRASRVVEETIVLPMHSRLDEAAARTVVEAVGDFFEGS